MDNTSCYSFKHAESESLNQNKHLPNLADWSTIVVGLFLLRRYMLGWDPTQYLQVEALQNVPWMTDPKSMPDTGECYLPHVRRVAGCIGQTIMGQIVAKLQYKQERRLSTCESSEAVQIWQDECGAHARALTAAWWRWSSATGKVGYLQKQNNQQSTDEHENHRWIHKKQCMNQNPWLHEYIQDRTDLWAVIFAYQQLRTPKTPVINSLQQKEGK